MPDCRKGPGAIIAPKLQAGDTAWNLQRWTAWADAGALGDPHSQVGLQCPHPVRVSLLSLSDVQIDTLLASTCLYIVSTYNPTAQLISLR